MGEEVGCEGSVSPIPVWIRLRTEFILSTAKIMQTCLLQAVYSVVLAYYVSLALLATIKLRQLSTNTVDCIRRVFVSVITAN